MVENALLFEVAPFCENRREILMEKKNAPDFQKLMKKIHLRNTYVFKSPKCIGLFSLPKLLQLLMKNKLNDHNSSICGKGMKGERHGLDGEEIQRKCIPTLDGITIVEKLLIFIYVILEYSMKSVKSISFQFFFCC